jgi:hypothetical protein
MAHAFMPCGQRKPMYSCMSPVRLRTRWQTGTLRVTTQRVTDAARSYAATGYWRGLKCNKRGGMRKLIHRPPKLLHGAYFSKRKSPCPVYARYAPGEGCPGQPFAGLVAYQLSITGRDCTGIVGNRVQPISPTSKMVWCGACGDEGRVLAGEAGDGANPRGVDEFGEGNLWQDSDEPTGQHRLPRPSWKYGQNTCNRNDFTTVTAGTLRDLQWLDVQRGTASKRCPSARMVMSQYPLGTRGPTCPPPGGWPDGVELEPPGVVQADRHQTTATHTARLTCVHHVGTVFQRCHMPVSSRAPDGLAGCRCHLPVK